MIFHAMELIRRNLNTFLRGNTTTGPDQAILGNIAFATPDNPHTNPDESAQVYISLVNVEEEQTLKNKQAIRASEIRPLAYVNPPLILNLYLLFASNHRD